MTAFRWLRWRGAILVLIGASSWPLHIVAINVIGIGRPERVLGIIVAAWLVGMLIVGLLSMFGVDIEAAENSAFAGIALVMNAEPIVREFGSLGYPLLLAFSILVGLLTVRLQGRWIATAVVVASVVYLATGPVITFAETATARGGDSVVSPQSVLDLQLARTPDIFVLVLDGYPGAIAVEQDGLDPGSVDIEAELQNRGFELPRSTWSSYWTTTLSIPSLLEMGYPVEATDWLGLDSQRDLQEVLSGKSAAVKTLRANGYSAHVIESGWSALSCGAFVDECVPAPLIDEATFLILKRTAASPLLAESPGPYVGGTLAAFDWLLTNGADLSSSPTPDFVFTHVVSPHPPLLLDQNCSVQLEYGRTGTRFNLAGVEATRREGFLIEQMDCMEKMMVQYADAVDPDDIMVFVSDHGTDRRGQADPTLTDWDREAIVERLNNFVAVRVPGGCSIGDEVIVPNVLRLVVGCISSSPVDTVPERMWVNPMAELKPGTVNDLMSMRATTG